MEALALMEKSESLIQIFLMWGNTFKIILLKLRWEFGWNNNPYTKPSKSPKKWLIILQFAIMWFIISSGLISRIVMPTTSLICLSTALMLKSLFFFLIQILYRFCFMKDKLIQMCQQTDSLTLFKHCNGRKSIISEWLLRTCGIRITIQWSHGDFQRFTATLKSLKFMMLAI